MKSGIMIRALIGLCVLGIITPVQAQKMEEERYRPGFNKVSFIPGLHFNARPPGTVVDTIILHHTASGTTSSCVRWFENPESKVSAHYVIGKDGSIIQMVNTFYRAWHAGNSVIDGRTNVNDYSVGIEIVNTGSEPYPEAQVTAVRNIVGHLCHYRYKGQIKQIASHEYIAVPQGRKNDPKDYPWDSLSDLSKELGIRLLYGRTDGK
jgi:N-acetylmuramoyl-L-alanine amidase